MRPLVSLPVDFDGYLMGTRPAHSSKEELILFIVSQLVASRQIIAFAMITRWLSAVLDADKESVFPV